MLLPENVRVFVATFPTDMRKSFNGLAGIVHNHFNHTICDGDLYVFFNKNRNYVKILWYEATAHSSGFSIWMRKLDEGAYTKMNQDEELVSLSLAELALLLEKVHKRK